METWAVKSVENFNNALSKVVEAQKRLFEANPNLQSKLAEIFKTKGNKHRGISVSKNK